jgi:hypothetical protein
MVSPGQQEYFLPENNQNNWSYYPVSYVFPLSIAVKQYFQNEVLPQKQPYEFHKY